MLDITYSNSVYALLPPALVITLAIVSRKVLFSIGVGIVSACFLLEKFSLIASAERLLDEVIMLFWKDGSLNSWNLYILGFLFLLGVITTLVSQSGSAKAFALWARHKIHTRQQSECLTIFLGGVIFIDDYFNSLVVGSVAQPLTDRFQVSRAKLAYLLDSTASPVCVLMPISSWGAYISAIIGGFLVMQSGKSISSMQLMVELIPYNFYAWVSLLLLICVVVWQLDVGPMKKEQQRAESGQLFDPQKGVPAGINESDRPVHQGHVWGLLLPIGTLVLATFALMLITGIYEVNRMKEPLTFFSIIEHLNLGVSLFFGALVSAIVALIVALLHQVTLKESFQASMEGLHSMLGAVVVLLFAWMMANLIAELNTGKYLSNFALASVGSWSLPVLMFFLTGVISFSTGSSWGAFGIMIPISMDMIFNGNSGLMHPLLAAVLSGAVFGDHCSPISDTTILSSTGAGCHHMDHVVTQLPYALIAAAIATLGFLLLGLSESLIFSVLLVLLLFVAVIFGLHRYKRALN